MQVTFKLLNYLFHLLFILWFLLGNMPIGVAGGILGIGFSVAILLNPSLLVKSRKLGAADSGPARVWGVGYFAISVLMISSFQIDTTSKLGLLGLILALTALTSVVMVLRSCSLAGQRPRPMHFVWLGASLVCVGGSVVLMLRPSVGTTPFWGSRSELATVLLGVLIGLLLLFVIEKLQKERDTASK